MFLILAFIKKCDKIFAAIFAFDTKKVFKPNKLVYSLGFLYS